MSIEIISIQTRFGAADWALCISDKEDITCLSAGDATDAVSVGYSHVPVQTRHPSVDGVSPTTD